MAVAVLVSACVGCGRRTTVEGRVPEFSGATMGTVYHVKVVLQEPSETHLADLQALIEAELEDVEVRMSTYEADSELSRFNAHESTSPFRVSTSTIEVFQLALEISELTNGAFDITVGPLVNAWGFGPEAVPENPLAESEIQALMEHTGYEKIQVDPDTQTITKEDPGVFCDLSAIAKGYAVDRVCTALEEAGYHDYMVEVGGEVRTGGVNGKGVPWRIGIVNPEPLKGDVERIVPLSGWAMATSGDYRNFYERNGIQYSHTIDPRTGRPVTHNLASVSVIDKNCSVADGYATAIMVMGPDEAQRWAEEHNTIAFFIVRESVDRFRDITTTAFEEFVDQTGKSPEDEAKRVEVGR
ncbi:MAG: FAD:protein FMN transferase [Candidatus Hydrogenedentota bacterium]